MNGTAAYRSAFFAWFGFWYGHQNENGDIEGHVSTSLEPTLWPDD